MTEPEPCVDPEPGPLLHEDRLDYTPTQRSVPLARRRVARLVSEWGQAGVAGDVALVVSELMTNALLHGSLRGRLIRVRVSLGHRVLRVEVTDPRGERLPSPRPAGDVAEQFGRGLVLVGALAARWGWGPRTVGKTVYAEWDVPACQTPFPYADHVDPRKPGGAL
ncbi:ATP-binding protein [Streptomyces lancefieldiae]|uniref:ATP-binding protein n=1 Tax=Streptomyces lancefieldiae TaxID=3075520 RepID=A0ABU3ASJ0_9ACTN|nr:ATP-binding protein [Streptomyces sp. DSM 40712]MDT0612785.1 ATP-binding protein [Streptomyces sp. DSM 40712]